MPVKEKRGIKKQIKRERILNAAADLFSQKSYHEVMMEDVAKMIGVAKGTVYNYFTSNSYLWPFKGDVPNGTSVDQFRNIFPLPTNVLSTNHNLTQNVGY